MRRSPRRPRLGRPCLEGSKSRNRLSEVLAWPVLFFKGAFMAVGPKRLAAAAVVVAMVAACDAPNPAGPMPQMRLSGGGVTVAGQLIAFASSRDQGLFQTFVMTANGSKVVQLTNQPFYNARPAWSHDGKKITFTTCRPWDNSCEIYVMNANGSGQTNLTNNFATDHMSVWSPDDRKIAFASDRDANMEIYVMDAYGSNQVRLTYNDANDVYPGWSPDGSKITFQTNRDGNDEIYVMNADGTSPVNLSRNPANDADPRWSPLGKKIAFDSDRDGNQEIYVMNNDGSRQTRLTSNPGTDYGPAWSPDGELIAFAANPEGDFKFDIYVMESDGSGRTRITNDPAWDADPAWTNTKFQTIPEPDRTHCVTSGTQEDINVRLRQPGDVAVLCAGAVFDLTSPVVFSADGQQVYTEGLLTDDRRAQLRLASPYAVTAVYMVNHSNTALSNVIVDGNQPSLGQANGQALILAGGPGSGGRVRHIRAHESRTRAVLQLFESFDGGISRCTNQPVA